MQRNFDSQNKFPNCRNAFIEISESKNQLVLIADGNAAQREELKKLLDLYDITVLEAATGEEALDLTVLARPDLILMNTDLPRPDGFETARLIRTIQSLNEMPIVFLSHRTERASRKKAFAAGGDGFHFEPLDLERLNGVLENFLFQID